MAVKLGTLLVREGIITPQQLEEALRIQVVYGGRLGTNLVELNFVDVEVMGEWLGRVTGFPVATQQMCEDSPPEVLQLIPAEMAERFECFPVRKDGRRLHLAMVSPADLAATDALSFKTGLRIVPYCIPELRLYYFLEKRYHIERKLRYIRLSSREDGSNSKPNLKPTSAVPQPPGLPPLPPPPAHEASQHAPVRHVTPAPTKPSTNPFPAVTNRPAQPDPWASPPRAAAPAAWSAPPPPQAAATPPRAAPAPPPGWSHPPPPNHSQPTPVSPQSTTRPELRPVSSVPAARAPTPWGGSPSIPTVSPTAHLRPAAQPEMPTSPAVSRVPPAPLPPMPPMPSMPPMALPAMPPMAVAAVSAPPAPVPAAAPTEPPPLRPLSYADAVAALESAQNRDEIGDTLVRFGLGLLDSVMLFLVRDGMALGWKGHGKRIDPAIVELIMLPLNAPSMFQEASESRAPFRGAVPDLIHHKHVYKALKRDTPRSVVVVPIVMRERAVNLIYGDRIESGDAGDVAQQLSELSTHVAAAYERIVRESKRRMER